LETLSINGKQDNDTQITVSSGVMLNVAFLIVKPSFVMLNIIMLSLDMLNAIRLSVKLFIVKPSVIVVNVNMLSLILNAKCQVSSFLM
jgi:hypothetical protein